MARRQYGNLAKPVLIQEGPAALYPGLRVLVEGEDLGGLKADFCFDQALTVHMPAAVRPCPLRYARVDDRAQPIIRQNLVFTGEYIRKPAS